MSKAILRLFYHLDKYFLFIFSFYLFVLLYFRNSVAMSCSAFYRSVLIPFVFMFQFADFQVSFISIQLFVKRFLKWVVTAADLAPKDIMKRMRFKVA